MPQPQNSIFEEIQDTLTQVFMGAYSGACTEDDICKLGKAGNRLPDLLNNLKTIRDELNSTYKVPEGMTEIWGNLKTIM